MKRHETEEINHLWRWENEEYEKTIYEKIMKKYEKTIMKYIQKCKGLLSCEIKAHGVNRP